MTTKSTVNIYIESIELLTGNRDRKRERERERMTKFRKFSELQESVHDARQRDAVCSYIEWEEYRNQRICRHVHKVQYSLRE